MSNFIKSSIADANTLVSVAEERAKGMFIKEFSPQVKSILAATLREEVSAGNDQPGGYEPEKDKDAIVGGSNINKNAGDGPVVTYPKGTDVKEGEDFDFDDQQEEPVVENDEEEVVPGQEDEILELDAEDEIGLDDEVLEVGPEDPAIPGEEEEPVMEFGDQPTEEEPVDDEVLEVVDDETGKDDEEVLENLKKEYKKIVRQNKMLREAVNVLRNKFNKLDLFNAKLALAYKLITQPGLTRSEKKYIAETFDKARTVREAKIIYTTLKNSIATSKPKPTNPLKNRNVRTVISESTTRVQGPNRMEELAGI